LPVAALLKVRALLIALALAGVAGRSVTVDAEEAAALISQYRGTRGLSRVTVDPTLMQIAFLHARRMAAADRLTHVLRGEGSFARRLSDGGFEARVAVENIAGGPATLGEALALWRRSPPHDRNLLASGVSKLGIGVATDHDSRYQTYWTLILGEDGRRVDGRD
jgi:uncharacterized protein YkwD